MVTNIEATDPSVPAASDSCHPTPTSGRHGSGAVIQLATKPPSQKSRKLTAVRGSGFSTSELDSMLSTVEHFLPLCRDEWDAVPAEHNKLFRNQMRTVDSLKRKFATLHREKMPTGDLLMPEEVRKAKQIRYKMTERANLGCGDEETDNITGIGSTSGDDMEETHPSLATPSISVTPESSKDYGIRSPAPSERETPFSLPSPRPLIAKRKEALTKPLLVEDILIMIKMNMMQEQQRREEDARRREDEEREKARIKEEEKQRREEDRREERQRREHESKRRDRYLEAILTMMASSSKQESGRHE